MNKVIPDTGESTSSSPVVTMETPIASTQLENGAIEPESSSSQLKESRKAVISYHDLNYDVNIPGPCCKKFKKQILHNLSGMFLPGMNAIMGPTGSGKTTNFGVRRRRVRNADELFRKEAFYHVHGAVVQYHARLLDVVAGRTESKGIRGDILVNGRRPPDNFRFMTGYVIQDDVVVGTLTVRENLMFSANLRLPSSKSLASKTRRVEKTINELGLTRCADTKVGTEYTRGVSGGERKRTNIGMELIIKPKMLFLDEPTTGLDSSTANAVMSLLHSLSRRGRTVIFSIHQPRFTIYKLFDRLTLLAAGRTVFHGPASETLDFFETLGYKCEEFNNPPDFFLDTINGDSSALKRSASKGSLPEKALPTSLQIDEKKAPSNGDPLSNGNGTHAVDIVVETPLAERLALSYRQSEWFTKANDELRPIYSEYERDVKDKENGQTRHESEHKQYYATSIFRQFGYISKRIFLNIVRNTQTTLVQTGSAIFFGVILGIIYLQLGFSYPSGLQDRVGALFFIAVNQLFSATSGIELFIKERVFFIHENASGFYRVSAYFFGKVFCDFIPIRLIPLIAFSVISYFMIGFVLNAANFFIFFLVLFLTTLAGAAIVFAISASVSVVAVGNLLCILIFIVMMIFGGLFVNLATMPAWLSWLRYLSVIYYSFNALAINELLDEQFYGTYPNGTTYVQTTGTQYLTSQGIVYATAWDFWQNVMAIGLIAIGVFFLAYVQLRRMKKLK